jgi:hypothetical protein
MQAKPSAVDSRTVANVLQPHRSSAGGADGGQGVRSVAELREVRLGGGRSVWVDSGSGYAYEPTHAGGCLQGHTHGMMTRVILLGRGRELVLCDLCAAMTAKHMGID